MSEQFSSPLNRRGFLALGSGALLALGGCASTAIAWEQSVADLMSGAGFVKHFDVGVLFDRRFEHIAAQAAAAEYQGQI